ncbi:putative L-ascorbate peroxidase 6, chloroplastic/mitochondrial isoform X1 [Nicotiana tabacum]|uniref:L-ascorbate peroxidase 6, chloroplastic/mitochondrial isoform X1 n=1 Tax=Nicotiana tabacum TaxID=4097 RepID=A0A1S3XBP3_TOBAC|nr:probable L-ascorbate peroxidase 6, chloroplastic/mitochondrial isoform X1 [Nicotiana tomentosiformis]XP_016437244.1 PREDICTED: probable L-ascorbate peroxidase 6, chloroplastic isoform X1 [Nicotiana tabacum]
MATNTLISASSPSPTMASSLTGAASRFLPSATIAATSSSSATTRLSLSSSSPSLKCLQSSPLLSHIFRYQKRSLVGTSSSGRFSTLASPKCAASDSDQLKSAREDIKELLKNTFCHPILVRLGWHDAGTYNKNIEEWPQRGGANGSLRFEVELKHGANAGLVNALKLLQPIKDKYANVTYADLFQLASATAIEEAGGPKLPMKYGRVDVSAPEECPEEGRLPDAGPPSPASHLRDVFYRMGLNDKEIVALSGAHTLGRSRPERSGWGKPETRYTKDGPGNPGGQSWTVQWLKFDNSYFKDIKERRDEDLLVLPTDAVLFEDSSFKEYAEKYAVNQDVFFKDYAEAHAKLSNLGAKFDPPEGSSIDNTPTQGQPEKFVAAKYSTGKRELSDAMKQKIRAEYEGFGGSADKPLPTNYFLNIMIVIGVLAILTSLLGN